MRPQDLATCPWAYPAVRVGIPIKYGPLFLTQNFFLEKAGTAVGDLYFDLVGGR